MAKKGFDLGELARKAMGDPVSKLNTETQVVSIPREQIAVNSKNFYAIDDIGLEELAASIELTGLIHPIVVKPTQEGGYVLVDGERRFRATGLLEWAEVPAIVRTPVNEILEELMLIEANRTQRKMSDSDLSKQAERYTELLAQLKESGVEIPGRLRDAVAEAMKISSSKLARLHAIREKLEPGLLMVFDDGDINESVAYELSKFDHQKQLRVVSGVDDIRDLTAGRVMAAGMADDNQQASRERPKKLPTNSLVYLPPMDAYRRRTSILKAARILGVNPKYSIQKNIEMLAEQGRTHRGTCGPSYDIEVSRTHVILDHLDRKTRQYTLAAFVELVAEMWIENDIQKMNGNEAPPAVSKLNTGLEWQRGGPENMPDPEKAAFGKIATWGEAGLQAVPASNYKVYLEEFPESYAWWAYVDGPKEDDDV